MKQLKFARTGYIIISITFYIVGSLCIILPEFPIKPSVFIGGIILIAYGIIKIIGYLSEDLYCLAFQYDFACGILLIVVGVIMLSISEKYQGYLLSGLGLLLLLDSLFSIQTSIDAKRFGLPSWPKILTVSILSGVLSAVLFVTDSQLFAGCALLAEGFMRQYIIHCTVSPPD